MGNRTKIRGITIELNADASGIMDGLKDINKQLSNTDKALRDTNNLLKFDENNTELVAQQQQYLAQAIEQTEEKLKREKDLLAQLQSADNASETVEQQNALKREIEATTQKLNGYKAQLDDTDEALEDVKEETEQAKEKTNIFGDVLKANLASEVIIKGVERLANGIASISKNAMQVGSGFESSMSQVAATMGMTSSEIERGSEAYELLSKAAKTCGETTMFSASQAADALNYLALAGYDAEKAADTLPKVLTLAAAGGMDLAYASDLVTDSMAALGMETDELDNYIDEMAKTAQKSNTSVSQLGEATLVCAGAVSLTGQDLETMNAELGVLANNGIKGAEGGTHLRNVLLSLSAPTDKAEIALKELGVEVKNSDGNMRNLNDIMKDLNASLADMGSAEKANTIKTIFNKTDIAAVNALMKATTGEFDDLKEKISDCAGAAKEMEKTMTDNLQGKITILGSALEGLGIAFYDVFDDNAKNAVDSATDAVSQLTDAIKNGKLGVSLEHLSQEFERLMEDLINFAQDALPGAIDGLAWFIEHLGEITQLLKGLGGGYVAYEVAVAAATIATEGFTAALSLNPIGLAAGAVVGLTVAFKGLVDEANKLPAEIEAASRSAEAMANKSNALAKEASDLGSKFDNEAALAGKLKSELQSLIDPQTGFITEQNRAKAVIAEMNELIPGLNLSLSEQGEIVSSTTTDWEAYIDVMQQQAAAEAITEKLLDLESQKLDQEMELLEIDAKITEETRNIIAASEEYADLEERVNDLTEEEYDRMAALASILHPLDDAQAELVIRYQEGEEALNNLSAAEETLYSMLEEANTKVQEASDTTATYTEATNAVTEAQEALREKYEETKQAAVDSLETQRDKFLEYKDSTAQTVNDIASDLETQAQNMQDYANLIAKSYEIMLQRDDAQGLLDYYISQGPSAAGELQNLVDAFNGDAEAVENFNNAVAAFNDTEALIDTLASYKSALETGLTEPLDNALALMEIQLPDIEENLTDSMTAQENAADEHRDNMIETTTGTIVDMASAVEDNTPQVVEAVGAMNEAMVNKTYEVLQMSDSNSQSTLFYNVGYQIDASLASGIRAGSSVVNEAIKAMCEQAVSSVDISGLADRIDSALGAAIGG